MTQRGNEFFDALRRLDRGSQSRLTLPEAATVRAFLATSETFTAVDTSQEIEERATSVQTYLVPYPNQLVNGSFETPTMIDSLLLQNADKLLLQTGDDLLLQSTIKTPSWTEEFDPGITATIVSSGEQSYTLFGSLNAAKINVTNSGGSAEYSQIYQDAAAAVGEDWSFEAWIYVINLANCKAIFRIEFQDSGDSVLSTTDVEITSNDTAFTLRQIEGETAPASTDHVRVICRMESTGASAVGTGYFDLVRAEKATTVSDRARRIICGEWVCRT